MLQNIAGKTLFPLIAAVGLGLLAVWLFQPQVKPSAVLSDGQTQLGTGSGSGTSGADVGCKPLCSTIDTDDKDASPTVNFSSPLNITSRPKAQYTDEARHNNVQGIVKLKVVLGADGQVGEITPLTSLPFGLTEQAIAAAREIKFEPRKVNGVAQRSVVTVEYSFSIY